MSMTFPINGVSGPGKFSVREDLPPSENYGDRKQMKEDIAGASTTVNQNFVPAKVTELTAPTDRPEERISTGMPFDNETPGPESILNKFRQQEMDMVAKYIPILEQYAALPDTPQSFRIFTRYLQGNK